MPKKSWKSSSLTFFFLLPFLFLYFAFGVYFLRARRSHLFSVCHWYWSCLIGDLYQLMSIFFSCTSRKPLRMKLFVCLPRRKLFAKKNFTFSTSFESKLPTACVCWRCYTYRWRNGEVILYMNGISLDDDFYSFLINFICTSLTICNCAGVMPA